MGKKDNLKKLKQYLIATTDWVTAEELAVHLHTTTRTVRNYVQEINLSGQYVVSSPQGYQWRRSYNQISYQLSRPTPQHGKERELYILRYLLYRKQVSLTDLSRNMAVSDRTVEADLVKVKVLLRHYGLVLHHQQDLIYLRGREMDKRRLTKFCIRQTTEASIITMDYLRNVFPEFSVDTLLFHTEEVLAYHWLSTNSYTRYELLYGIIIQLYRLRTHDYILDAEIQLPGLQETMDHQAAAELAEILRQQYGYTFTDFELDYLALLILCNTDPIRPEPTCVLPDYDIVLQGVNSALSTIGGILQSDFSQNGFPLFMAHYISRLTIRHKMQMFRKCPLTRSLRETSPALMDIAASVLAQFCSKLRMTFPEDEVGLLTLYLGEYMTGRYEFEKPLQCTLVCPTHGTLAEDMAQDLNTHLSGSITVTHTVDIAESADIPPSDLIVSVLPLQSHPHTVVVAPFLQPKDYRQIHHEIYKIRKGKRRWMLTAYLDCYLRPDSFETNRHFASKEETIRYICEKLQQDRAVEARFTEVVLHRENVDSTVFYNMMAIPHCCSTSVMKNSIYVILNREPMPWGEEKVNLVFLCAIQRDLLSDFYTIYDLCIKTFSSPKNIQALQAATDRDSFIQIISQLDL